MLLDFLNLCFCSDFFKSLDGPSDAVFKRCDVAAPSQRLKAVRKWCCYERVS